MTRSPLNLLLCLLLAPVLTPSPVAAEDASDCVSHPLFNRFPGESLAGCERSSFNKLELYRWIDSSNPAAGEEPFSVEGEYWLYHNPIDPTNGSIRPSRLELVRNYENAIREANGTILNSNDRMVVFLIRRAGDAFWGESGCGGDAEDGTCATITHRVVRVADMEQVVTLTAEQIGSSIADAGKAVFYGIYFDSGQSVIKPESAPTLAEMAKWLQGNPQVRVYIVGHTDMQGDVGQNRTLSRARAEAVVNALVTEYGLSLERLAAEGAGPFAPVSNNTTEQGRAQNRRVEMVLR